MSYTFSPSVNSCVPHGTDLYPLAETRGFTAVFVNVSLHEISNEAGAVFIIVMSSLYESCSHFTINPDVYIFILLQIINPLKNSVSCCIFDVCFSCCVYILTLLMSKAMRFFRRSLLSCNLILQGGANCHYTVILLEFPLT